MPRLDFKTDDAWDWSVDEVVSNLCYSSHLWADRPNSSLGDPSSLEIRLREFYVSGSTLLALTPEDLRVDLALQNLRDRHTIYYAINKLRSSSRKYKPFSVLANADVLASALTPVEQLSLLSRLHHETFAEEISASQVPNSFSQGFIQQQQSTVNEADCNEISSYWKTAGTSDIKTSKPKRRAVLSHLDKSSEPAFIGQVNIHVAEDNEWDFLLEKYPSGGENDEILPLYGESEDGGYGSSTQAEIDQEAREQERKLAKKTRVLLETEVDSIVGEVIEEMTRECRSLQPSEQGPAAQQIWDQYHGNQSSVADSSAWIRRLENRLETLQKEIRRRNWTTEKELRTKCESLRRTISDRVGFEWQLKICQMVERPSEVTPRGRHEAAGFSNKDGLPVQVVSSTVQSPVLLTDAGPPSGYGVATVPHSASIKHVRSSFPRDSPPETPSPTLKHFIDLTADTPGRSVKPRLKQGTCFNQQQSAAKEDTSGSLSIPWRHFNQRQTIVGKLVMETCSQHVQEGIWAILDSTDRLEVESKTKEILTAAPLLCSSQRRTNNWIDIPNADKALAKLWICWMQESQRCWNIYRFKPQIIEEASKLKDFPLFYVFITSLRQFARRKALES